MINNFGIFDMRLDITKGEAPLPIVKHEENFGQVQSLQNAGWFVDQAKYKDCNHFLECKRNVSKLWQ